MSLTLEEIKERLLKTFAGGTTDNLRRDTGKV